MTKQVGHTGRKILHNQLFALTPDSYIHRRLWLSRPLPSALGRWRATGSRDRDAGTDRREWFSGRD